MYLLWICKTHRCIRWLLFNGANEAVIDSTGFSNRHMIMRTNIEQAYYTFLHPTNRNIDYPENWANRWISGKYQIIMTPVTICVCVCVREFTGRISSLYGYLFIAFCLIPRAHFLHTHTATRSAMDVYVCCFFFFEAQACCCRRYCWHDCRCRRCWCRRSFDDIIKATRCQIHTAEPENIRS